MIAPSAPHHSAKSATLHVHAHCERGGLETGAPSMGDLPRIPEPQAWNRRVNREWTRVSFWTHATTFFRVAEELDLYGQLSLTFGEPV